MSKTFSVADVAAHKDANAGMYIIVDENVYDVTGSYFPSSFPFRNHPIPLQHPHTTLQRKGRADSIGNRIRRRTPRRVENSEEGSGQGRDEAVLEIS